MHTINPKVNNGFNQDGIDPVIIAKELIHMNFQNRAEFDRYINDLENKYAIDQINC